MTSSTSSASPLLLAVESSTFTLSLCLSRGEALLAEEIVFESRNHTELLLPRIDLLLRLFDLELAALELFAIGLGPGSFTGLRIGLSTLKALAWSQRRPLIGVNSLDALALDAPRADGWLCVAQDARKKEVYSSLYRVDGYRTQLVSDPSVLPAEALADELAAQVSDPEALTLVGSGATLYREVFAARFGRDAVPPSGHRAHQVQARDVARLALQRWRNNDLDELAALEPEYVRPSEAELGPKKK